MRRTKKEWVSRRVWSNPMSLEGIPRIEQQCNPGALVESSIRAGGGGGARGQLGKESARLGSRDRCKGLHLGWSRAWSALVYWVVGSWGGPKTQGPGCMMNSGSGGKKQTPQLCSLWLRGTAGIQGEGIVWDSV